jgi:hypothetical protein
LPLHFSCDISFLLPFSLHSSTLSFR